MSLLSDGLDDDDDTQTMGGITVVPHTNAQAKNALGIATNYLARAYAQAQNLTGAANLRQSTMDLLDRNRKYVETLYRNLPGDDQPLTSVNAKKVQAALKQTESNVSLVTSVDATMKQSFLAELANNMKAKIANAIPGGGSGILGTTLKILGGVVVVGGIGYYLLRRTESRVIQHVSGDDDGQ